MATGSALVCSTYLGGSSGDEGNGIAVDPAGNAYVTGRTDSPNFPTVNPLQPAFGGGSDAFVAKLEPNCGNGIFDPDEEGDDRAEGIRLAADCTSMEY